MSDPRTTPSSGRIAHTSLTGVVEAERAFLDELGGDCELPAGCHATVVDDELRVEGMLASLDGHAVLRRVERGDDGPALGRAIARHLLGAGGAALLGR